MSSGIPFADWILKTKISRPLDAAILLSSCLTEPAAAFLGFANGVSPFIAEVYDGLAIDGQKVNQYAAGYMWGTMGLVYNPEEVTEEQASSWKLLLDKDLYRRITVKDSVRDAFFAAASIHFYDEITAQDFLEKENYSEALYDYLNRTDQATVDATEEILSAIKRNVY